MHKLSQLVEHWLAGGKSPYPAAQEQEIRQLFLSLGSTATQDVVNLYARIGGMDFMDEAHFRLWPLAEISSENSSNATTNGILFADYLISCWGYLLLPVSEAKSAVYVEYFDGQPPVRVADSLEEFSIAYFARPNDVLHNPPELSRTSRQS